MEKATITNVQRFSLHDGGGIRTVAFCKGCPFRCPWCCNPENLSFEPEPSWNARLCIRCSMPEGEFDGAACPRTADECPTAAKEMLGRERDAADLAEECLRDRVFFAESGGGVTLSGGECLARQDFAMEFLEECHARGAQTAVETTLALPLRDPARLVAATDVFLVDFKVADRSRSLEVTGIDPDLRDRNLRRILALGASVVARMPVIPGFTDARGNVTANVSRVVELGIRRADVLPFHQLGQGKYESTGRAYTMGGVAQLHEEDVRWVADLCEGAGLSATISGA